MSDTASPSVPQSTCGFCCSVGSLLPVVVIALLALLFGATVYDIGRICWNEEDYSHGLLLPAITAFFLWEKRAELKAKIFGDAAPVPFSLAGLALLVVGLAIYALGSVSNLLYVRWVALFPTLLGACFMTFGTGIAPLVTTPLLLNFMAKPIPDALVPKLFFPLQVLAAKISAWVLDALNVPVYITGNIIEIPGMQLMVEEACSGMRSVFALLTVAVIVLYSVAMPFYAKTIVFFSALLVAICLNVVRVAATGVLAYFYDPDAAKGFFHSFAGMIVFILGLVILYGLGTVLNRLTTKPRTAAIKDGQT